MSFNTAILYDIENLLKGYAFSQRTIINLSLKEIVNDIKKTNRIGEIAIQRAYANWSDPRLGIMRGEINELGIEPMQVFGFSQDQKKNAADIQLVVDAIDLAHIRPALEVFVIVSGDGGFAALAKKLHEYGRTVIGCGYRKATNRIFQSVCDVFVEIADPEQDDENHDRLPQPQMQAQTSRGLVKPPVDPRITRLSVKVKRLTLVDTATTVGKTREIMDWFVKDPESFQTLKQGGMHLSVVREAIKYAVPDFQPIRSGFPKFAEYLQFACSGTPLCLARFTPTDVVLMLRDAVPQSYEVLPDIGSRDVHSAETYLAILSAPGGQIFKLPARQDLYETASWLARKPLIASELGTGIELATSELYPTVSAEAVKLSFLTFVAAGLFKREPEGVALAEQKLTMKDEYHSDADIILAVRTAVRNKLGNFVEQVNEDILQEVFPT